MELMWLNTPVAVLGWIEGHLTGWKMIGYLGTLLFAARWLVQLCASRRAGYPVIPRTFWYMSVSGSLLTLAYFMFSPKQDSVGILQNLFPACTAGYSLLLDIRQRGWKPRMNA